MKDPLCAVTILIAAYNEAPVIGQVLDDCRSHGFDHILVVDDGSTDDTAKAATNSGATVISLPLNCGKSAAISTGFQYLARRVTPPSIVVLMDADGQHLAKDISALIGPIKNSPYVDLVCGVRKIARGTPLINRLGRLGGDIITWLHTGRFFPDSQCGFRALRLKRFEGFEQEGTGYAIETQLLDFVLKKGLNFVTAPVSNVYTPYSMKKAHKQGMLQGLKTLVSLLK